MFKNLFKQGKSEVDPTNDELPPSLEAALEGMSVTHRGTFEDRERTLLCFAGEQMNGWHHTPTETQKRILAAWPNLNNLQLERAMRAINGAIRASMREAAPPRQRSAWASWSPDKFKRQLFGGSDYDSYL